MKYCDDANCTKFDGDECELGFSIRFRLPQSMADAVYHNWGYVMAKACRRGRIGKSKEKVRPQ